MPELESSSSYVCGRYAERPQGCRRYPWRDGQILFRECVFMTPAGLESYDEAVSRLGEQTVASACIECGRCCFRWIRGGLGPQAIAKCSHLTVQSSVHDRNPLLQIVETFEMEE